MSDFIPPASNFQQPVGMGATIGVVKAYAKELSPIAKPIIMVAEAAIAGKTLADNIQSALDRGESPAEAYISQTANTLAKEITDKTIKSAISASIPAYMAAAVVDPALALTVPAVATLLPPAYEAAAAVGRAVGHAAEEGCHQGFRFARNLTKKKED